MRAGSASVNREDHRYCEHGLKTGRTVTPLFHRFNGGAIEERSERLVRVSQSENHKEAVRAFVEKRRPVFNRA